MQNYFFICILFLSSCAYKIQSRPKHRVLHVEYTQDSIQTVSYTYCGTFKAIWQEPEQDTTYKDTTIIMLLHSLKHQTLLPIKNVNLTELTPDTCSHNWRVVHKVNQLTRHNKPDTLQLVISILHNRAVRLNTSNAFQGHVSSYTANGLSFQFNIWSNDTLIYSDRSLLSFNQSPMNWREPKQKHIDRLVAKALKRYHKRMVKNQTKEIGKQ